jgi:hypothetical protein
MIEGNILDLLKSYIECAEQIAQELRAKLGVMDLLAAANSGAIPRQGICKSFGGGEYYFHGVGCRVQTAEVEIDFDFGQNGCIPGADPWKLYSFADAHVDAHPWLPSRPVFDQEVRRLVDAGVLCRVDVLPSPHLLRLC